MKSVTMDDVATKSGVSKMTVSRALRGAAGVDQGTIARIMAAASELGYVYTPKQNSHPDIERLLTIGASQSEVVEQLGVSRCSVYQVRRKLGLPKMKTGRKIGSRNANRKWETTIPEIRRLKASGLSYKQIGSLFGVTHQCIQQLLSVPRGDHCEECGAREDLHGHHIDYLTDEHKTLCNSCHRKEHARLKSVTRHVPVDLTVADNVSVSRVQVGME